MTSPWWSVWTPQRVALLRRLWVGGKTGSEIASLLGLPSRCSAVSKANRLGLRRSNAPRPRASVARFYPPADLLAELSRLAESGAELPRIGELSDTLRWTPFRVSKGIGDLVAAGLVRLHGGHTVRAIEIVATGHRTKPNRAPRTKGEDDE